MVAHGLTQPNIQFLTAAVERLPVMAPS